MSTVDLSRLTAIVRTCRGPKGVDRLIRSLGWLYPQVRVLVADDSRQPGAIAGVDPVRMPAGAGVSACRNALLARVRTPYFLVLEEEMELSRQSHLERLLALVAENRLDLAGGDCQRCQRRFGLFTSRRPDPGHATFEFSGNALRLAAGHRPIGESFLDCDLTHNFFVGRTDKVRAIGGWDPQLTTDERFEFFVRAQRFGLRVGMCADAIARRWADGGPASAPQGQNLLSLAAARMGVARLIDLEGRMHESPPQARAA